MIQPREVGLWELAIPFLLESNQNVVQKKYLSEDMTILFLFLKEGPFREARDQKNVLQQNQGDTQRSKNDQQGPG